MRDRTAGLSSAAQHAREFLDSLDERPVAARVDAAGVRDALGGPLPEHGEDPATVIDTLVAGAEPGLVASAGPRHFGFVIGGALPAALAADWLVSAWDQNAAFHALSPAAAAIEEIVSEWTLDLFGLPADASVGFVTGGQAANTTCLAAARHAVLAKAGLECRRRRPHRRPTGSHPVRRAGPRDHRYRAAATRTRRQDAGSRRRRRPGPDETRRTARGAGSVRRPDDCLRPGRERGHRRLRCLRTDSRRLQRPRRLAARGRRIRAVGCRRTRVPPSDGRCRAGRLVGRGRP